MEKYHVVMRGFFLYWWGVFVLFPLRLGVVSLYIVVRRLVVCSYIFVIKSANTENPFDEDFSDRCMGELIGTSVQGGTKCVMSRECLGRMFQPGGYEYQLTHQLLYMIVAEQTGCLSKLDAWLEHNGYPGGVHHVQLEFCTNNLAEMQHKVSLLQGTIIPIYQDLFLEQEFVCPSLGFMEFLHFDWLKQILSWQKASGCFGRMYRSELGKLYKGRDMLEYSYLGEESRYQEYENDYYKLKQRQAVDNPHPAGKLPQRQSSMLQAQAARRNSAASPPEELLFKHGLGNESPEVHFRPQLTYNHHLGKLQKPQQTGLVKQANNTLDIQGENVSQFLQYHLQRQEPMKSIDFMQSKISADKGVQSKYIPGGDSVRKYQNMKYIKSVRPGEHPNLKPIVRSPGERSVQPTGTGHNKARQQPRVQEMLRNPKFYPKDRGLERAESVDHSVSDLMANNQLQEAIVNAQAPARHLLDIIGSRDEPNSGHWTSRKLLVEKPISYECLSHKTAVAAGALSQYLRFLLYPGPDHYQRSVALSGPNYLLQPRSVETDLQHPVSHVQVQAADEERDLIFEGNDIPYKQEAQRNIAIDIDDMVDPGEEGRPDGNEEEIAADKNVDEDENDYDNYVDEAPVHNQDQSVQSRHINPKFLHNGALAVALEDGERDEEYEQYIDEDEEEARDIQVKPLQVLSIPQKPDILPLHGGHDQEEGYYYYYAEEEQKPAIGKTLQNVNIQKHIEHVANSPEMVLHPEPLPKPLDSSLGRIYMCIFVIMMVFMGLLYRFIKKRRVVIRYYHR